MAEHSFDGGTGEDGGLSFLDLDYAADTQVRKRNISRRIGEERKGREGGRGKKRGLLSLSTSWVLPGYTCRW